MGNRSNTCEHLVTISTPIAQLGTTPHAQQTLRHKAYVVGDIYRAVIEPDNGE